MQDASRLGAAQNVAFNAAGGASAASTAFGAQTYQIRVSVSGTGFRANTLLCRRLRARRAVSDANELNRQCLGRGFFAADGWQMRIGLFISCHIDAFFPEVGIATLELLERLG